MVGGVAERNDTVTQYPVAGHESANAEVLNMSILPHINNLILAFIVPPISY